MKAARTKIIQCTLTP